MPQGINRRAFLKDSLLLPAGAALAAQVAGRGASGQAPAGKAAGKAPKPKGPPPQAETLPQGKIDNLKVSRLLLGGNLLTHYTHSRDLKYVYNLTAHYNTEEKILQTLALAERHGINTLVVHTVPRVLKILRTHRRRHGGKIQWIICPTAPVDDSLQAYTRQVQQLADDGVDAVYVWGVHADQLVAKGRTDLLAKAVERCLVSGVPAGVGAHNLKVVAECEKHKVPADFYIKTFHHHRYPSAPKPEQIKGPYNEVPGYWCSDPKAVIDLMKGVKKPWIAFKVMAAGAIPPADAFPYAFANGADHVLAGMFDFEIAEDAAIARKALATVKRARPWRS
jgi:hypothetical protein